MPVSLSVISILMDDWKVSLVKQLQHLIACCTRLGVWSRLSPPAHQVPCSFRDSRTLHREERQPSREGSRHHGERSWGGAPSNSSPRPLPVALRIQRWWRFALVRRSRSILNLVTPDIFGRGRVWRNWPSLFAAVIKSWHESWERIELRMLLYTECPVSRSSAMEPQGQLHHILPASQLTSRLIQPSNSNTDAV